MRILRALFVGGVCIVSLGVGCSSSESSSEPTSIETERVRLEMVDETVTVSGVIGPYRSRILGFPSTGRITSIDVQEGQWVAEGTPLARIDASAAEYEIASKEYELEQARYTESPRKIALIERELLSLRQQLRNQIIFAPFDGTVATITQREGEIFRDSGDTGLITFIDETKLKADVVVDELDIARISVGQTVLFYFDSLPKEGFDGRVSRIAHIGRINEAGLPVGDVELVIDTPDSRIFIPSSFQATITTAQPTPRLVMSERAVVWRNDRVYAWVSTGPNPTDGQEREIHITPWREGRVVVLDGVAEGDAVRLTERSYQGEDSPFE